MSAMKKRREMEIARVSLHESWPSSGPASHRWDMVLCLIHFISAEENYKSIRAFEFLILIF